MIKSFEFEKAKVLNSKIQPYFPWYISFAVCKVGWKEERYYWGLTGTMAEDLPLIIQQKFDFYFFFCPLGRVDEYLCCFLTISILSASVQINKKHMQNPRDIHSEVAYSLFEKCYSSFIEVAEQLQHEPSSWIDGVDWTLPLCSSRGKDDIHGCSIAIEQ